MHMAWYLVRPRGVSVFVLRDAMHKRGLCRHAVSTHLSVCSSITFVDSVKTTKHIVKTFSPSGSQTTLDFSYQTSWQYSDGDPPP